MKRICTVRLLGSASGTKEIRRYEIGRNSVEMSKKNLPDNIKTLVSI
jgi:hypothetical protein